MSAPTPQRVPILEMGASAGIKLSLPARAESVATARRAVAGLGRRLGLTERRIDDLRTVVSEACMNAALHAYEDPNGRFEVSAAPQDEALCITVSDRGRGIRPRTASEKSGARLGLLLIAALSESVEIARRRGGGTRLRIRFAPSAP